MKAILFDKAGDPSQLYLGEYPSPIPSEKHVLVEVKATALNRADTLQRKGLYPPPLGASPILGLEMAGEVVKTGAAVSKWKVGDRIMALLPGGGYAEYAVVPEEMGMRIPAEMEFEQAAAIPEVFLTAYQALIWLAKLKSGERVLIHAGASGVGTAAIQIAKSMGAEVVVTASAPKHKRCLQLGASHAIDYRTEDFYSVIDTMYQGEGVQVIIDFLAAAYWEKNLASLGIDGRMVLLALLGGAKAPETNLGTVLRKRLQIMGSTLRARNLAYKTELTRSFWEFAQPKFQSGIFEPVIDSVVSWEEVVSAHERMEANLNTGKIVLSIT